MIERARIIGFAGGPESGKTQLALRTLLQLRDHAAWVCAHDPHGDMPDRLYDGTRIPLHRVSSTTRLLYRLNSKGFRRGQQPIHVLESSSPTRLVHELMKLSSPDAPGVVLVDELGMGKQASRHRLGELLGEVIAARRHNCLTVLWGAQFLRQVHYAAISQSNYMVCARMKDKSDLSRLKEGGVDSDVIDIIRELPDHKFVTVPILGKGYEPAILPNPIDAGRPRPTEP